MGIIYKGKGEHSVNDLEIIIDQMSEELHQYKSGQIRFSDDFDESFLLTKEEVNKLINWSYCPTHCHGGQHVSVTCKYVIGEIPDLDLMVKFNGYRQVHKNKEVVLDCLYELYVKYINDKN